MQPEVDRIAKSKRNRVRQQEIAFLPVEFAFASAFPRAAEPVYSCLNFSSGRLWCEATQWELLSQWTFKGQGKTCTSQTGAEGNGGPRSTTVLRGPPKSGLPRSRPILGNGHGNFGRVGAFHAAGIDRSDHVEVCLARLNRRVRIRGCRDQAMEFNFEYGPPLTVDRYTL